VAVGEPVAAAAGGGPEAAGIMFTARLCMATCTSRECTETGAIARFLERDVSFDNKLCHPINLPVLFIQRQV